MTQIVWFNLYELHKNSTDIISSNNIYKDVNYDTV